MLVRRPRFKWFLQIDGTNVVFFLLYGYAVCVLNLQLFFEAFAFPFTGISVFGTAVAVLLGFRNNSAYERYWEARTVWGDLMNASRNFGSQLAAYLRVPDDSDELMAVRTRPAANVPMPTVQEIRRELVCRHLAYVHALRMQLREETDWELLRRWISSEEWDQLASAVNKATHIQHRQVERLAQLYRAGWMIPHGFVMGVMESVKEIYRCQGASERIKQTPLPRAYAFFTKIFVWVFVLLLPFGLVPSLGWETIPVYATLATVFTIIERLGSRTESPFEKKIEDVPLNALCRTIEIDLLQQLGAASVPAPLEPQDGVLL